MEKKPIIKYLYKVWRGFADLHTYQRIIPMYNEFRHGCRLYNTKHLSIYSYQDLLSCCYHVVVCVSIGGAVYVQRVYITSPLFWKNKIVHCKCSLTCSRLIILVVLIVDRVPSLFHQSSIIVQWDKIRQL